MVWMNPPYSEIWKWVKKAAEEAEKGATVIGLIPARTDTDWWHTWVMKALVIRFIRGRIQFVGADGLAPFPSVIVIWSPWKPPEGSHLSEITPITSAYSWRKVRQGPRL